MKEVSKGKEIENNLENISRYTVNLGQYTRNGLKLLMAKYDMTESNVVSMALNKLISAELNVDELNLLHDDLEVDDWVKVEMDANKGLVELGVGYEDLPSDYSPEIKEK